MGDARAPETQCWTPFAKLVIIEGERGVGEKNTLHVLAKRCNLHTVEHRRRKYYILYSLLRAERNNGQGWKREGRKGKKRGERNSKYETPKPNCCNRRVNQLGSVLQRRTGGAQTISFGARSLPSQTPFRKKTTVQGTAWGRENCIASSGGCGSSMEPACDCRDGGFAVPVPLCSP